MNWLDIILVCLAGIGLVKGLFDGIIKQAVSLIAVIAAIYFYAKAGLWLQGYIAELHWFSESTLTLVGHIAGFIFVLAIVLLVGELVHRLIAATPLSLLNHLGGGILGLAIILIFTSLIINIIHAIDPSSVFIPAKIKQASFLYEPIKRIVPTFLPVGLF